MNLNGARGPKPRESSGAPWEGANLMIGLGLGSCQASLRHAPKYTFWHGPVIGQRVSHVWSSFATCIFLEFGSLTPGDTYTNRKGQVRQFQPAGEWSMTSMESWSAWRLRRNGTTVASWEDCRPRRTQALHLLIGRRLHLLQIDQSSKSTRLTFSLGLQLETKTDIPELRREPHWLMRGPDQRNEDSWHYIPLTLRSDTPAQRQSWAP